ncbi:MAG: hypothetical protein ACOYL3_28370, partial [Desulfuromonadaceae bacterium]
GGSTKRRWVGQHITGGGTPADWSTERKREYLDWTCKVVSGCRGVNQCLDLVYDDVFNEGKSLLI